jgi:hypothetical protein
VSREPRGVEFAWRVHTAITDWTAKVDVKASIVLALETAGFAALVAVSRDHEALSHLVGASLWLYRAGIVALVAAVSLAGAVVMPQLRSHGSKNRHDGLIYFGHLRQQNPAELKRRLDGLDPSGELDELAYQLIQTSNIAWKKHRRLQASLLLSAASAILLAGAWIVG